MRKIFVWRQIVVFIVSFIEPISWGRIAWPIKNVLNWKLFWLNRSIWSTLSKRDKGFVDFFLGPTYWTSRVAEVSLMEQKDLDNWRKNILAVFIMLVFQSQTYFFLLQFWRTFWWLMALPKNLNCHYVGPT